MHRDDAHARNVTRRRALGLLGALGLGAVGAACSSDAGGDAATPNAPSSSTTASSGGSTGSTTTTSGTATSTTAASCMLTPEVTEGPYYLDLNKVRTDIVEDRNGTPLELRFTVLDATSCAPIKDAAVDVWHCDASGVYSGFGSAGGGPGGGPGGGGSGPTNTLTFLRGTQVSDASGAVVFRTIYPGWYPGRAVHIHLKVHVGGSVVHTGQVFFADSVNDAAYKASPYNTRPTPDVRNAADSIYRQAGGKAAELDVAPNASGYTGSINLGVKRSSTAGSSRS